MRNVTNVTATFPLSCFALFRPAPVFVIESFRAHTDARATAYGIETHMSLLHFGVCVTLETIDGDPCIGVWYYDRSKVFAAVLLSVDVVARGLPISASHRLSAEMLARARNEFSSDYPKRPANGTVKLSWCHSQYCFHLEDIATTLLPDGPVFPSIQALVQTLADTDRRRVSST